MKKELPFLQSLKNIKYRDLAYPGILALFFGLVIILFFFAMRFISQSINKAFSPETNDSSQVLDRERYQLVARKLNIPVNIPQDGTTVPASVPGAIITPQVAGASIPQVVVLDKKAITIMVRNSTAKKGVGAILAKALLDSGFQKPQTGNESRSYATTTVLIKESRNDYKMLLLETVHKIYPDAVATTSPESDNIDATIIIGNH